MPMAMFLLLLTLFVFVLIFLSKSSTHERKSKTAIIVKHERIYLKHNSISEDVPIVVAMKV